MQAPGGFEVPVQGLGISGLGFRGLGFKVQLRGLGAWRLV